jgi:hypothetical protein
MRPRVGTQPTESVSFANASRAYVRSREEPLSELSEQYAQVRTREREWLSDGTQAHLRTNTRRCARAHGE